VTLGLFLFIFFPNPFRSIVIISFRFLHLKDLRKFRSFKFAAISLIYSFRAISYVILHSILMSVLSPVFTLIYQQKKIFLVFVLCRKVQNIFCFRQYFISRKLYSCFPPTSQQRERSFKDSLLITNNVRKNFYMNMNSFTQKC
jgi:hypothetical protein